MRAIERLALFKRTISLGFLPRPLEWDFSPPLLNESAYFSHCRFGGYRPMGNALIKMATKARRGFCWISLYQFWGQVRACLTP